MKMLAAIVYGLWFIAGAAILAKRHETHMLGDRREVVELLLLALTNAVIGLVLFSKEVWR